MTLAIPPGFGNAALTFTSTVGTAPLVTTIGVNLGAAGGDYVGAANSVMSAYAAAFADDTDNALTLDKVTLAVGDDGPGGSVDSDILPIPMTGTGDFAPVAMSAIARKVTNVLGRRGRGRMFLPGTILETGTNENGDIGPTELSQLQTAADTFIASMTTGFAVEYPTLPVLLHSVAPFDPTPLTGLAIATKVGWVRGRIR